MQSGQCGNVKILRSEDQWISPKFNFIGWNNSDYFTCPENSMVTLSQKSRILKLNVCYVLWQCMSGWHFCLFCRNKVSLKWKIQCLCFTSPQHGWGPHHWHGPCSEPFSANLHFWVWKHNGHWTYSLCSSKHFLHPLPDRTLCFYTEFLTNLWGFRLFCKFCKFSSFYTLRNSIL